MCNVAGHEVPFYIQLRNLKEHDCQDKIPPQSSSSSVTVAFDQFVLRPRKVSQKTGKKEASCALPLKDVL